MAVAAAIASGLVQQIMHVMDGMHPALRRAGVLSSTLPCGKELFPLAMFTSLLEAAGRELIDDTFGLSLGRRMCISVLGQLGALMEAAPTVGDALSKFVDYFGLVQTNTRSCLAVSGDIARLSYGIMDQTVRFRIQDANFTIAMEYKMIRELVGESWMPRGVEFSHAPGGSSALYRRHFACPIHFNAQQNALLLPASVFVMVPRTSNARRFVQLDQALRVSLIDQNRKIDLVQGLEAWMAASICHDARADIAAAAADFGMSTRSFQRNLYEHGVNYGALRTRVLLHLSQCLLADTDLSITSIGQRLGYSETSAFSRAFRQQTGFSPRQYRVRYARNVIN